MKQYFKDPSIQRQVVLENYKKPHNRGLVTDGTYKNIHMDSESCIDDIHVQVKIIDNVISDIRFDGEACTISTATASMMNKLVQGKSRDEVLLIIENYRNMVLEKPYDEELLEEANVFSTISKQPNRIKCALLPWDGLYELLKEEDDE